MENKKINYYEIADKMAFEEYHFQFDGLYKLSEREVQFIAGVMSNDLMRAKLLARLSPEELEKEIDKTIKDEGIEVINNDWGKSRNS